MEKAIKTMTDATVQTSEERLVAQKILAMLEAGRLVPGDRLPAERKLALEVKVSRAHVRAALQKLEFYGIVKTWPQSGTVLAEHPISVLKTQIHNILDTDTYNFYSLVQTRVLLEQSSVRLCALNRTEEDIETLKAALKDFEDHATTPLRDEKDFDFHLAIARASHNPVLASLLLIISPDVLKYYRQLGACTNPPEQVAQEHRRLLDAILEGDPEKAEKTLREHLSAISQFSEDYRAADVAIPRTRI